MDEQTAKHLVKIMEGIQKDLHVIASNKEVLEKIQTELKAKASLTELERRLG